MLPALLGLGALLAPVVAMKAVACVTRAAQSLLQAQAVPVVAPPPSAPETANEVFSEKPGCQFIFIFAYDGMGRRTKITELVNGAVVSKKLYFWLGGAIVCERDGLVQDFPITKRYFAQGLVQGSDKLYYTRDHLGSIRQVVDATDAVRADYRYTTYGERTRAAGDLDTDWGYAGLWHHAPSGLDLATHRIYDSTRGRWLSRDPLGEGTDRTLYSYAFNSPVTLNDPSGLDVNIMFQTTMRVPHVFIRVTQPADPRGYIEADKNVESYQGGLNGKGVINFPKVAGRYNNASSIYTYKTSPDRDNEVIREIQKQQNLTQTYHATRNNCGHFVADLLEETNIDKDLARHLRERGMTIIIERDGILDYYKMLNDIEANPPIPDVVVLP